MTTESPRWFKSTYSDNGGVCVEVAANLATSHGVVPVRDSKHPTGPALTIPTPAFTTFAASIRTGTLPTP
ncbi:DUF397 domain-containing protein [Streptomyces durbertensis]|uniref:DUF397 domain-containing protein n=1 Tax=Streptomyces durbertensis TaxID=2448886 RepID=A0ABR6EJT4_9ACTN|nr:DUF397 domain-containing protein [Streptomyces durbertensis]MBB1245570.1 DUF397 domain-containing protein [Streptomyces durbertensis]